MVAPGDPACGWRGLLCLVREAGFEPARLVGREILSLLRLPVPSLALGACFFCFSRYYGGCFCSLSGKGFWL